MPADIDQLPVQKSVIDLTQHSQGDFGLTGYKLSFLFDDIILVKYIDTDDDNGDFIKRGSLFIDPKSIKAAWRKAEVILAGPNVKYVKPGDIVMFPNDKGVSIANLEIENYGFLNKGMFLNEQRLFGICKPVTDVTE
jgi:hypothetical protein